ncbi:hypothetical protein PTKIN_Ptkin09bG0185700 [Pterospermum kingtungense]
MDLGELWAIFGLGIAGAVFGASWWFWIDAVICSSVNVSFLHYLPGIFSPIAALMFNCVRKDDIDYSPYEEGEWRSSTLLKNENRSPTNQVSGSGHVSSYFDCPSGCPDAVLPLRFSVVCLDVQSQWSGHV